MKGFYYFLMWVFLSILAFALYNPLGILVALFAIFDAIIQGHCTLLKKLDSIK